MRRRVGVTKAGGDAPPRSHCAAREAKSLPGVPPGLTLTAFCLPLSPHPPAPGSCLSPPVSPSCLLHRPRGHRSLGPGPSLPPGSTQFFTPSSCSCDTFRNATPTQPPWA